MVHKISVHFDVVFIAGCRNPCVIRILIDTAAFLQEYDVTCYLRPCRPECVIRETDCSEELRPFCQIPSDTAIFLVHGPFGCNEGAYAPGSQFVERFAKEIVMDKPVFLIILLIAYLVLAEGDVPYGDVIEVIRKFRIFVTLDLD